MKVTKTKNEKGVTEIQLTISQETAELIAETANRQAELSRQMYEKTGDEMYKGHARMMRRLAIKLDKEMK